MIPCPRCGEHVPEVLGAPTQRCPHCGVLIRPPPARAATGPLLGAGLATLVRRAPTWWAIFLVPALVVEAASWGAALAHPDLRALLVGCGASPVAGGPVVYAGILGLVFVSFAAYFVGWARVAAAHGGIPVDRAWWRRVVPGSLLLAAIFLVGILLLVLPALLFFAWFLFSPVALGRGAGPVACLDAGRAAGRRRPAAFTAILLAFVLVAEGAMLAAGCVPGLAGSLAAQALAWWLLAPVVPVLTTEAFARLEARGS